MRLYRKKWANRFKFDNILILLIFAKPPSWLFPSKMENNSPFIPDFFRLEIQALWEQVLPLPNSAGRLRYGGKWKISRLHSRDWKDSKGLEGWEGLKGLITLYSRRYRTRNPWLCWCLGPESNRYGTKYRGILSPLRLPLPPPRHHDPGFLNYIVPEIFFKGFFP